MAVIGNRYGTPGLGQGWVAGVMAELRYFGLKPQDFLWKKGGIGRFFEMADTKVQFSMGMIAPGYEKGSGRAGFIEKGGYADTRMEVAWYIQASNRRVERAMNKAAYDLMREAVAYAKANHGGWKNRTGNAEKSIRIIKMPLRSNKGEWGAGGLAYKAVYFPFLEYKYQTLRNAQDHVFTGENMEMKTRMNLMKAEVLLPKNAFFQKRAERWVFQARKGSLRDMHISKWGLEWALPSKSDIIKIRYGGAGYGRNYGVVS